jgi:uncharacterized surface protein with fasciclin (FAS1) repeats
MKNFIKLFSVFTLLFIVSCSDDNEIYEPEVMSITNLINTSSNYTFLAYALDKTDLSKVLDGSEKYTLLAPSNMAFRDFLINNGFQSIDDIPEDLLKQVLLNHVMTDVLEYRDIESGYYSTVATSNSSSTPLSMYIEQINMRVTINGAARITQGNVRATNGIVHAVNAVIPIPTVVTFVTSDYNLANLRTALTRNDLTVNYVNILSTQTESAPAPFTVFAPTDQAFFNLLTELNYQSLSDIDEPTLRATLNHHVIAESNALSTDLSDNLELTTLGGKITANVTGGATITDGNNRVSKITAVDIQANNGVIHVIDKVILPN